MLFGRDVRIECAETDRPFRYHHVRHASAGFQIDQIVYSGVTTLAVQELRHDVVFWVHAGTVAYRSQEECGDAGRGEVRLLRAGRCARSVELMETRVTVVHVINAGLRAPEPSSWLAPRTRAAADLLKHTLSYVTDVVNSDDRPAAETMADALSDVLRTAARAGFNADMAGDDGRLYSGDFPGALRAALTYIDANAARRISVAELAAEAFATPRTVQYLFRRYMDTTPTAHLRRVRLSKARQELLVADRSTTTVSATANRWGFGHTGRFAVVYRDAYGESPHETLER